VLELVDADVVTVSVDAVLVELVVDVDVANVVVL
jgi:hypothetical protein